MYRWWVFVHLVGVFGFLLAHGVSVAITFKLRSERDPRRVGDLLQLSGSSGRLFYVSLAVLLVGGVVAGFIGDWWGRGWIWASLAILIIASLAMLFMARPYYRRVRLVSGAMAGGSAAVTPEQFDDILGSGRPVSIAAIGLGALAAILYLMVFKPTLGLAPAPPPTPTALPSGPSVSIGADNLAFDSDVLSVPASEPFSIVFANREVGVPHNVSIYTDSSATTALFTGKVVSGPTTVVYRVKPLEPGTYFFRCDVHPDVMTGTVEAG